MDNQQSQQPNESSTNKQPMNSIRIIIFFEKKKPKETRGKLAVIKRYGERRRSDELRLSFVHWSRALPLAPYIMFIFENFQFNVVINARVW